MTKTTAHANCQHPSTKAARAACRKAVKATVQTVTTDYGTFEIITKKARDLKKTDMVLYRPETSAPFFSGVTYDAFQQSRRLTVGGPVVKVDSWRLALGGPDKFLPGDTEFTVAADPKAVKDALWARKGQLSRSLTSKTRVLGDREIERRFR